MSKSDFPEFDAAYYSMLIPDNPDKFDLLAAKSNFNMYHHDLWRGTAQRFAREIVRECVACCGSQVDKANILRRFDMPVESNIQYSSPEKTGSIKSQYTRQYNLPQIDHNVIKESNNDKQV